MESFFLSQFLTPNFSQGHYRGEVDGHLQKTGSRQKYGVCLFFYQQHSHDRVRWLEE